MKQERAVQTRHTLIRAAARVFEERGYAQASLREISAVAGMSVGALHFHFASKAHLFEEVEAAGRASLHWAARQAERPGMDALQKLTAISNALAVQIRTDVVSRAGFHLSSQSEPGSPGRLQDEWRACVGHLLKEAARQDLLDADLDVTDLADAYFAATLGMELLSRKAHRPLSCHALAGLWQLTLPSRKSTPRHTPTPETARLPSRR